MSQLCKNCEKPDTEGYILYGFMSMDFWKRHNYSHRNGTTIHTEMYLWLPGFRSGRRSLMANTPREHFRTMGHFLHFYCGSFYSTVYICQNSTNCNALKCWLLLYTNYTSILFLKGKGTFKYLNIGYCIHLDHELKNIKIVFWNSSQTWTTSRISHDSFVLLWQNTQTWS